MGLGNKTEKYPPANTYCPCPGATAKAAGVSDRTDRKKTTWNKDYSSFAYNCFSRCFLQNPGGIYDSLGTKLAIHTFVSVVKTAGMGKVSAKRFHQVSNNPGAICLPRGFEAPVCCGRIFLRGINNLVFLVCQQTILLPRCLSAAGFCRNMLCFILSFFSHTCSFIILFVHEKCLWFPCIQLHFLG